MADHAPQQRAKHPRNIIAGPYGHPYHPVLVTVPIGAWLAVAIFDLAGIFTDDAEAFARGALWLTGIGIIGALAAAVLGFLDYSQLAQNTKAKKTATIHMALNLTVTVLFAVAFFIRLAAGYETVSITGFIITLVGLALLGASGYLGGTLAYHYGVRVADEQTQSEGYR